LALRSFLRRLEKQANEGRAGFVNRDGRVVRYDPDKAGAELFVYAIKLWSKDADEDPPEVPPILRSIREEARDPEAVLRRFEPDSPGRFMSPVLLLDPFEAPFEDGSESPEDGA